MCGQYNDCESGPFGTEFPTPSRSLPQPAPPESGTGTTRSASTGCSPRQLAAQRFAACRSRCAQKIVLSGLAKINMLKNALLERPFSGAKWIDSSPDFEMRSISPGFDFRARIAHSANRRRTFRWPQSKPFSPPGVVNFARFSGRNPRGSRNRVQFHLGSVPTSEYAPSHWLSASPSASG